MKAFGSKVCFILAWPVLVSRGEEPSSAQFQFFENRIRPLLANHCYKCHSHQSEKVRAGLFLDNRNGILKGGKSGPAIVPGEPDQSLLIKAVRYTDPDLQMPPQDQKLAENEIQDLVLWVQIGAPDPRVGTTPGPTISQDRGDPKTHWAWQPLRKPRVPDVKNPSWCRTPIDNFILEKLEQRDIKPNPPAEKLTLIRRATFDLIGLPPTAEEVNDFLQDSSKEAFARVVDRLLASPHYGERWARHWLDVARYSDTKGQIRRQREDPRYPFAWSYRDYVIRSFNEDKPYDVFILEQIAADKLPATARNPGNLAALGFLTVGDRFMGMPNDIINDRIDVVTKGFLSLTVSCARCHDHKFDPIPTEDYYSLYGVFASSAEPRIEPVISKIVSGPSYEDYYKQRMALQADSEAIQDKLRALREKRDPTALRPLLREMRQTVTKVTELEMTHPAAPERAMVLVDAAKPRDYPVLLRGEAGHKGPVAPRRFLGVLSAANRPSFTNGSGRLELALAITSKSDPLPARVMINRLWLHHFGEGFVPTPDDFGTMSESPSHPELLDYLASRFIEEGWSIKKMHSLILLSSVYQESCANDARMTQLDQNNRLLWRANVRRLEFEPLRDSLLAIGGNLDAALYGRPVDLEKEPFPTRRTVYGVVDRSDVSDMLFNFDFANPDLPTGRRHQTTVPQQALFLMNSPLVVEQAKRIVALPDFQQTKDDRTRIGFLYQRIYQRPPQAEEIALGLDFVSHTPCREANAATPSATWQAPSTERTPKGKRRGHLQPFKPRPPLQPWEEYAHALLQANETSFLN